MQDPEIFLNELGVHLQCIVEPNREAQIDAAHRLSIGYESFFFCDSIALQTFLHDVPKYCGTLTDPVTMRRFRPVATSPQSTYHQRLYLFASDSCKQAFDMMPDNYAWPRHHMIPKDSTSAGAM